MLIPMKWRLFSLSPKNEAKSKTLGSGKSLYLNHCQSCHRSDFSGNPQSGYPALIGIRERLVVAR